LLALLLLKPLLTYACLKTGTPGGLFTPLMACGALLGEALRRLLPDHAAVPGSCALIGSGAVLAAATQAPLSSVVFVIELTHRLDGRVVPLLLTVFGAVGTARLLGTRGVYARAGRD
jgi:H+/Cl- antiporter ClcA